MGWAPFKKHTMYDYFENMIGWPQGFFKEHTAEELGLTQIERAELIAAQMRAARLRALPSEEFEAALANSPGFFDGQTAEELEITDEELAEAIKKQAEERKRIQEREKLFENLD